MRARHKILTWWNTPIARGWALCSFLILAIGIGLAVDGVRRQDAENAVNAREARQAVIVSGSAVAVAGCNRDYRFAMIVRQVLEASKRETQNSIKRRDITLDAALRRFRFYDEQLERIALPDCRQAAKIITDRKNRPIIVPKPLYPPEG